MKKKIKDHMVSAREIINILEFLHSGISWISDGDAHTTKIGDINIKFVLVSNTMEFRSPKSWVRVQTINENSAKRVVSDIKLKLLEAKDTNSLLECLNPADDTDLGITVVSFWGL